LETEKFKLKDLFDGIVIPIILVLLIFFLAIYINVTGEFHIIGSGNVIGVILTTGFAQMIVLGIPMILGLLWNKWAGGAAGFIMGGMYYVASAGLYTGYYAGFTPAYNFYGDMSMLGYLVNAVVIGYIAGSLNHGSTNFKRMLGAGLTAAIITAVIQTFLNLNFALKASRDMAVAQWADTSIFGIAGAYGFILSFVPSIALGIIVPILGKVMTWYGIQPLKH
jgi:hypothetical protein